MTRVQTWMTKDPVTIDADASIVEAIHLLKEKNIRRLPVMKKGRFVGLLTERMLKEYTPSRATSLDTWEVHYILSKTPVREAMNPDPPTVRPDTNLIDAAQLIHDKKLNGICVTDTKGNLVGILTITDILEALIQICKNPQLCSQG